MSNKVFCSKSVNWIILTIMFLLIVNIAGYLVSTLYDTYFTLKEAGIYSLVSFLIVAISYFRHIEKIEITDDQLIIHTKFKSYKDYKYNFQIVEKSKVTRTLHRYKILILKNKNLKKRFIIDSDDWKKYEEIKNCLMEEKE